eukprot:scaffold121097_cov20-Tisochrysis_lutea.AAC.3
MASDLDACGGLEGTLRRLDALVGPIGIDVQLHAQNMLLGAMTARIGSPQPSDSEVIQGNQQRQSRSEDSQGSNSEQPLYEPKVGGSTICVGRVRADRAPWTSPGSLLPLPFSFYALLMRTSQTSQFSSLSSGHAQVSTWGLFPRPSNISSAYGGGRTIKPGDPIEDPEAAAKRIQANNEALARYKRKVGGALLKDWKSKAKGMGLEVDERVEAEADALYRQGMECFNKGNLEAALRKFDEAASKVQVR